MLHIKIYLLAISHLTINTDILKLLRLLKMLCGLVKGILKIEKQNFIKYKFYLHTYKYYFLLLVI